GPRQGNVQFARDQALRSLEFNNHRMPHGDSLPIHQHDPAALYVGQDPFQVLKPVLCFSCTPSCHPTHPLRASSPSRIGTRSKKLCVTAYLSVLALTGQGERSATRSLGAETD